MLTIGLDKKFQMVLVQLSAGTVNNLFFKVPAGRFFRIIIFFIKRFIVVSGGRGLVKMKLTDTGF